MSGDVIKSFLVGLGFDIDESELAKFNKSITMATLKVAGLSAAIVATAAGIGKAVTSISKDFEDIGYQFRIISPAINKALVLRNEMLKAYSATGMNITEVVQNSVKLNMSLDRTKIILDALYKSVGSRFFVYLTKQSDQFRALIYKNLPKIQNSLEKFIKFIFKALEAVTELGVRLWSILTRVYDFFVELDKATDGWSTIILGVVAAWKLLNLSFLATPLGMLLTGFLAILALYDDFKTFEEGGKSFFNWTPFLPVVAAMKAALSSLWEVLKDVWAVVAHLAHAFMDLIHGDSKGYFDELKQAAGGLIPILMHLWDLLKNVWSGVGTVGKFIGGLFNGNATNVANNIQNNPIGQPVANPISNNTANSSTNMHVQQQTSINVIGSADTQRTGAAVASQQGRVNRDLVDNMRGSTR